MESKSHSYSFITIVDYRSPGYGLFLTAETTDGVVYHGEAMSKPKGCVDKQPSIPEEVGDQAAQRLLEEIYRVCDYYYYSFDCRVLFAGRLCRLVCAMSNGDTDDVVREGYFDIFIRSTHRLHNSFIASFARLFQSSI